MSTPPGAPLSAPRSRPPISIIPNPSPNHQTASAQAKLRTSAGLTARAVEQPDPDEHLHRGEGAVPHREVTGGDVGAPDDEALHHPG